MLLYNSATDVFSLIDKNTEHGEISIRVGIPWYSVQTSIQTFGASVHKLKLSSFRYHPSSVSFIYHKYREYLLSYADDLDLDAWNGNPRVH